MVVNNTFELIVSIILGLNKEQFKLSSLKFHSTFSLILAINYHYLSYKIFLSLFSKLKSSSDIVIYYRQLVILKEI